MADKLQYFVTGPSYDGKYGIAVIDIANRRNAATMPYLKMRSDAEHMVMRLNEEQLSISVFCTAFSTGVLDGIV